MRRRKRPSKEALTAAGQVLAFMATRLGYATEQITEAAKIWSAQIQAGKAAKDATQIDMIEALERLIERETR